MQDRIIQFVFGIGYELVSSLKQAKLGQDQSCELIKGSSADEDSECYNTPSTSLQRSCPNSAIWKCIRLPVLLEFKWRDVLFVLKSW